MYLFKFNWNEFHKNVLGSTSRAAITIDIMLMITNLALFSYVTALSLELLLLACETVALIKIIANSVAMSSVSDTIDPIYVMPCDLLVLRLILMIVEVCLILWQIHKAIQSSCAERRINNAHESQKCRFVSKNKIHLVQGCNNYGACFLHAFVFFVLSSVLSFFAQRCNFFSLMCLKP